MSPLDVVKIEFQHYVHIYQMMLMMQSELKWIEVIRKLNNMLSFVAHQHIHMNSSQNATEFLFKRNRSIVEFE